MVLYFDMCCLKRPFDDQSQARIQLETQAVVYLEQAEEEGRVQVVCSLAQEFENARNSNIRRAAAVSAWLNEHALPDATPPEVHARARDLEEAGLRPLDALHVAWSEHLRADVLVTTDDVLLRKSRRIPHIMVRVSDPLTIARELAE
jgi:predicted nucleic acid-binding protein